MADSREGPANAMGEGIRISDEVVGIIAGIAASEVQGVASMSGGLTAGISEAIGRRNLSKGIKVNIQGTDCSLDVHVLVHYGARIPDVALEVQKAVKSAVESMTGLSVNRVNVHVQGIQFSEQEQEPLESGDGSYRER